MRTLDDAMKEVEALADKVGQEGFHYLFALVDSRSSPKKPPVGIATNLTNRRAQLIAAGIAENSSDTAMKQ